MKNITLWVFVAWVLLAIADIWFDLISGSLFWKLTVTLGLIWCLAFIIKIVLSNNRS